MSRVRETREPILPPRHGGPSGGIRIVGLHCLSLALLAGITLLAACGGSSSSGGSQSATIAGNWQFSMANPDANSSSPPPKGTLYGLQGGFLLESNGKINGQAVYSISGISQTNGAWAVCDGGSAPVTGTLNGQTLTLTATAGSQTFSLQGTLSDGQITNATFTTPGGSVAGFNACGSPANGLSWSATSVPTLTGSITGSFHSASNRFANQSFAVTGNLTQSQNIGASNASVTGSLSFLDPVSGASVYPCVPSGIIYVNGQISGDTVVLQLIGVDGSNSGQIGVAPSQANLGGNNITPVTFNSTTNGYALQSPGYGYVVNTSSCPTSSNAEDIGYICLAVNSATGCKEPIVLSPVAVSFPAQSLGSTNPSTQTITVTNNSGSELDNLTLSWSVPYGSNSDIGQTDFTNIPNFAETDSCVQGGETLAPGETGAPFSLQSGASCTATIAFAPQAECTWLPAAYGGTAPAQCPLTLTAQLTVNNVVSDVDADTQLAVPISGTGSSFLQPSTPELDFGAEALGETSLPQILSFTNTSLTPVQILPYSPCTLPSTGGQVPLTHPLIYPPGPPTSTFPAVAAGLQVVVVLFQNVDLSTILYNCDYDPESLLPNFQISDDTCSGTLLAPQEICSVQITFVPQPKTYFAALDYFLQLNTVQCTDPVNDPPSSSNPCELDGGRVPVEIKANPSGPLRMAPGAGLDFGNVSVGKASVAQTITLLNDPNLNPPQTIQFSGKFVINGNYSETDNCPFTLSSGASCTINVTFTPGSKGHNPGTITINYSASNSAGIQTIYMRGSGQ